MKKGDAVFLRLLYTVKAPTKATIFVWCHGIDLIASDRTLFWPESLYTKVNEEWDWIWKTNLWSLQLQDAGASQETRLAHRIPWQWIHRWYFYLCSAVREFHCWRKYNRQRCLYLEREKRRALYSSKQSPLGRSTGQLIAKTMMLSSHKVGMSST